MDEVGAELAGEHLGDQIPQGAPALLTEQHPSGGVNIVTRDNDMAQTLLLARKLNKGTITFCTEHTLSFAKHTSKCFLFSKSSFLIRSLMSLCTKSFLD